jgi:hypothetical protein
VQLLVDRVAIAARRSGDLLVLFETNRKCHVRKT